MAKIMTSVGLCAWAMAGCSSAGPDWVGTWEGRNNEIVRADRSDVIADTLRLARLTIKADGTFVLEQAGMPRSGNISFGKDRCLLTVQKVLDRRIESLGPGGPQTIRLEKISDGKALLVEDGSFHAPIELTRMRNEQAP